MSSVVYNKSMTDFQSFFTHARMRACSLGGRARAPPYINRTQLGKSRGTVIVIIATVTDRLWNSREWVVDACGSRIWSRCIVSTTTTRIGIVNG